LSGVREKLAILTNITTLGGVTGLGAFGLLLLRQFAVQNHGRSLPNRFLTHIPPARREVSLDSGRRSSLALNAGYRQRQSPSPAAQTQRSELAMQRMEHIPEPEGNGGRQELLKDRVIWLLVSCIVFGVLGNSLYILLSHGSKSPMWCWLIVAMTLGVLAALCVKSRMPPGKRPSRTWKGRIWRSHAGEKKISMHCPARNPNVIEVRGTPSGPLDLLIQEEGDAHVTAKVQCLEHFGITGYAELTLRSDNRIALMVAFNDGTRMEEIFSRC
jgi:hypothetical protein